MKRVKIGFEAPETMVRGLGAIAKCKLVGRADVCRGAAWQLVEAQGAVQQQVAARTGGCNA
jgi:hypothetical protein